MPQEEVSKGARLNGQVLPAPRVLEDFQPGLVVDLGSWRISVEEIIEFAAQWDAQPMHLDEEAGAASLLGGLAASGWHSCCILSRMVTDAFLTKSTIQGGTGIDRTAWRRPVHAGDLLHGETGIRSARPLKTRSGFGIVLMHHRLVNQRGELAVEFEGGALFRSKELAA